MINWYIPEESSSDKDHLASSPNSPYKKNAYIASSIDSKSLTVCLIGLIAISFDEKNCDESIELISVVFGLRNKKFFAL